MSSCHEPGRVAARADLPHRLGDGLAVLDPLLELHRVALTAACWAGLREALAAVVRRPVAAADPAALAFERGHVVHLPLYGAIPHPRGVRDSGPGLAVNDYVALMAQDDDLVAGLQDVEPAHAGFLHDHLERRVLIDVAASTANHAASVGLICAEDLLHPGRRYEHPRRRLNNCGVRLDKDHGDYPSVVG